MITGTIDVSTPQSGPPTMKNVTSAGGRKPLATSESVVSCPSGIAPSVTTAIRI